MESTILAKLAALRPGVRSLILLYWIQSFAGGMVGAFNQIFLYQKFSNISLNVLAIIIFYTGIMVGFCGIGYLASLWKLNVKHGFLTSFLVSGGSIIFLLHTHSIFSACIAMAIWGFGQGILWLTVNTFELSETKEGERDFYSSVLTAGTQILSLIGPATATLLIWISGSILHLGTFTLLFTVAPLIYLLGLFCFSNLRDYHAPTIHQEDIHHFFADRTNQVTQLYTLGNGVQQFISITAIPLVIFFILGTALRVGIYDTLFTLLSAICIMIMSRYRTEENRLTIYGFTTLGLMIITAGFGFLFSFTALVAYTLLEAILSPINNVSSHVIDLHTMEIGRKESDFYATMILRDFFLWVYRMVGGALLYLILLVCKSERLSLSIGLYVIAGALAVMYFGAYLLYMKTTWTTRT